MASSEEILGALRRLEDSLYERLTVDMERRFGEFRLEINGRFGAIEQRPDRLETEYQMIVAALRRIEEALAPDRADWGRVQTRPTAPGASAEYAIAPPTRPA